MSEIHQPPRGGQASDPFVARACLGRFLEAAHALKDAWHPDLDLPTYPRYLPAFYEFVSDLETWREEVEDRPYVDPKPLNLADRAAVRAWLDDMRKQVEDATAAGEDATRPPSKRDLGRRTARHILLEARGSIQQLLQAVANGLG